MRPSDHHHTDELAAALRPHVSDIVVSEIVVPELTHCPELDPQDQSGDCCRRVCGDEVCGTQ
jgi:hypothetical protein